MKILLKIILYPFSCLYTLIIRTRNIFYNINLFKSHEFKFPVISTGNITVGGTGKTPHTEYLIRLLKDKHKIAFLSRGYKRKTKGFILGNASSTVDEIGDEPRQILGKFPDIVVAVDAKRANGIRRIMELHPETEIVLLDDAYQHRSVKPGINILLIDYNKPIFKDSVLPSGRLREPASESKRADIVIVTKVPEHVSALDKSQFLENIGIKNHQKAYFTTIRYANPQPVFQNNSVPPDFNDSNLNIQLVTGIANAKSLLVYLQNKYTKVEHLNYPDHYFFTTKDIQTITNQFEELRDNPKIILTTEKDATRFRAFQQNIIANENWYYIPIEVEFLEKDGELFNNQIINYVNKNS